MLSGLNYSSSREPSPPEQDYNLDVFHVITGSICYKRLLRDPRTQKDQYQTAFLHLILLTSSILETSTPEIVRDLPSYQPLCLIVFHIKTAVIGIPKILCYIEIVLNSFQRNNHY